MTFNGWGADGANFSATAGQRDPNSAVAFQLTGFAPETVDQCLYLFFLGLGANGFAAQLHCAHLEMRDFGQKRLRPANFFQATKSEITAHLVEKGVLENNRYLATSPGAGESHNAGMLMSCSMS
jgi:hypothetical protein